MKERGVTMLKSMTGFGRCEMATDEYKISVEMKAVNHRYLDLSIKMPKKFNYFEAAIRAQLKKYIQRGKVDVLKVQSFPGRRVYGLFPSDGGRAWNSE